MYSLLLAWIADKLARSPSFEGRPDRRDVEAALERIAHRVLAQRDWHDETPTQRADRRETPERVKRGRTITP